MKKKQHLITIRGSKGKGGGGSTFEADDNMFARQSAAFIDAIAEGPIKGLVYGDASILVDEVRLRNVNQSTGRVSSTSNFNNFTVITKNGDATQVVDADFFAEYPSAAFTQDVGSAELLESEPQYFTISSGTFEKRETDYVKITVSTTGMSAITKKGDNKGDINTTTVYFTIDFQWVDNSGVHHSRQMFDTGFNGKVSGKYAHTFGFNIENIKRTSTINDWAVKVTKLASSPDSTENTEVQNAIYVDSIEAAIADKLEYPYTAYVGGVIDAEAFNSIPARGYEIDGKLIQIPSNHYPCDYNGRKLVVANASSFAVGDVIGQTLTISSLTASGNGEEGYTATATLSAAHGVAPGETFKATIATTASTDEDFYEGTFVCTATTTTAFTYTLNKPFNETTGEYKTLSSTTCGGTKTASMFAGGLVDKKVGNTLYLRNVSAASSAVTGTITNQDNDSTTVTSSSQVFIPANYRRNASTEKPTTSEQDWDGTFYQSWCNNPAWVYNDLITNKIYGLGNYLGQAQVNKWELFQIGRYCDELVPAGVGAADLLSIHCTEDTNYIPSGSSGQHEPRFSANLVISGKQEAYKVLNDVTSIFRGMTYWLNGEAYIVQDSEKDPVYQFTNANVIDGQFSYEGTANKTRTNSIIVNWNNPQDYYRSRAEIVELEETLQKDDEFIKPEETTAFGCTSRGQARRLGKWKLLTNNWNTNTVSFSTSVNAAFLRPGDIIQVIDQQKEGKSWGGRISNDQTASGTTSIIRLDRHPTGFGTNSVETGYAVGDYRLTCSFVGYKAILAQDTATIGGTAYVRGDHLTSITTEEAAARQQDDSGNLVFIQWTPFTYTETRTLSAVNGTGSLTVSSAFTVKPTAESIWVLSRAALATGKTKLEAKLFRVMSIAETDRNIFEVTGLEYNASKFDAVDKNEALTQYRTIYLPDSFKEVPAVENIDVEPKIRAAGTGGTINSLVVDWDPATNSDGSLYTSVRHYEVEFSKDNEKWHKAGTNQSTDYEIMDMTIGDIAILSGTYYFRVYLVSLNGIRGPMAESGAITVDFNRAVGPAEGSVGTDNHFINFIGNISGDFSLEAGKVTFSPANIFHNDGKNEHAVTSQPQLDFTGLTGSNTDNNGANTGYVFFDHSANQFKAIAFDETSGQFYPVGSNVFATGTGNLTSSTSSQPRRFIGINSPAFTTELAVGNVFKYTSGSNTRYHRVKRITNSAQLFTFNPTRDTLTNKAFSKPTFLVDYANDTIMGKIVKDGSGNYTLQKFGSSQGESAYDVGSTNLNFTFDANLDGTVTNESAYSCDFIVKKGSQNYTFANSGTAQHTFGLSLQARTGFDNDSDIVINSSTGQVTIGDGDMDAHTAATATIRIFDRGRADLLIADKILSFTKASQGTAGEDAKVVVVTPSSQIMTKEIFPDEGSGDQDDFIFFHPSSITVTAHCTNTTQNGQWSVSGGSATTNNTITNGKATATVSSTQIADDMTLTYTLHADDGGVADTTQLHVVDAFSGSVQPVVSNPAHVLPASKTGVVSDYSGSGTTIKVFQGAFLLDYDGVGTSNGHWKVTIGNTSGITEGTASSTGSSGQRYATISDHSAMDNSADTKTITYTITGKDTRGTAFTFVQQQNIVKSKTGSDGSAGQSVRHETIFKKNDSTLTSTTGGTFSNPLAGNTDWSLSMPALTADGDIAYAASRTFTSDGASPQDSSWTTPVAALTRTNGTNATALTITSTQQNTPSTGRTTVNFSDGTSIIIDDGDNGDDGDGVDVIYQNASSAPSTPSASAGAPTGWSFTSSAPAAGEITYISFGVRTNNTGNYSWSVPNPITAVSHKVETIFRKNSTSISASSGTYANPLAGNTSWSLSMPELDGDGDIAYASTREFYSDGRSTSNWTTPVAALTRTNGTNGTSVTVSSTQANTPSAGRTTVNFSDGTSFIIDNGTNGSDGDGVDVIYQNSTGTPSTPSASSGAPSGWSFTMTAPTGNQRTFISFGVRTNNSGNYSWSTPSVVTARDGDPGQDGTSANTVFYKKNSNIYVPPSKPSGNITSTSTADNVWTNSALAAEANHVVYRSTGSNSTGSWVWSAPVIDVDLDGFTDVFEFNYNWDFSDSGLGFIGLSDDTYNNTQTGNSRTLTITSASAAYNSARALPNGTDTTGQIYGIVTTGLPSYGGLTYPTGHKVAPSAFFIEAVQSGGYSLITFQNFQIGMTGDITYALNSKTNLNEGGLYIYLSAGISSSATTYSQVTNGDLGEVLVYNSLSFSSFTTDFGIEVQSAQIIVPDASKSVGSGYLWIWPEAYLSNVSGVANSPKINIIDRTDSKIILARTVGSSQTGTFSNSTNTASIARS